MEKFKYIKNIDSNESTILLYDEIGGDTGINGSDFANEMQYLQCVCNKINVRINSVGGSVIDGYSIISAILNCKVPVDTYIDGVSASISAVIAMCGRKVCMMDYGTLMIHNPSGADQVVLDKIKETLITLLTNRTELTPLECNKMMNAETYLNAKECMDCGMIDEIITSKSMATNIPGVYNTKEGLTELANIYNSLLKNNKKDMKLSANQLNLDENSSEEVIVEAIKDLQKPILVVESEVKLTNTEVENKEIVDLIKERDELKVKLDEFIAEKEAVKHANIEEMVNSFITSGKLDESQKESTIKLANVDFEAVKNMISKIGTSKASVQITSIIEKETSVTNSDSSSWTIREWEKKDPKGLAEIQNINPERYTSMYNSFYKK